MRLLRRKEVKQREQEELNAKYRKLRELDKAINERIALLNKLNDTVRETIKKINTNTKLCQESYLEEER